MDDVTIHDVARRAGVSIATVSYALNDKPGISGTTRQRIKQLARDMGYTPNPLATGLLSRKTDIIAVIVPDLINTYCNAFVRHIEQQAQAAGFFVLLGCPGRNARSEKELVDRFVAKKVDGVIVLPGNYHDVKIYQDIVSLVQQRRIPLVFMGLSIPGIHASSVACDLEQGQHALTRSLLDRGYRRLVFVGGPRDQYYPRIRYRGFMRALTEAGIDTDQTYLVCGDNHAFADGVAAMERYLARHDRLPEAFMAMNDSVALGLYRTLRVRSLRVPEDVSLTGFDDIPLPTVDAPELTTVTIPLEAMSRACIEAIQASREDPEQVRTQTFPLALQERESVRNRKD
jgi:LacI family transcriptional regulator